MAEYMKRHYLKEEEFLDEFFNVASVASKLLNGAWEPNTHSNDSIRHSHKYFLSNGILHTLIFNSASVYHDENRFFSSVQLLLESSQACGTHCYAGWT
jgi:hypothetical protein